jgi:hypothetical protein
VREEAAMQQASNRLIDLIKKNTGLILERWEEHLINDPTTPSFSKEHIDYVVARARNVLVDLETWIGYDASKDEIGRNYAGEGMKLFELGIPLCEAHRALVVLRRMLWNFVEIESDFDTMFELSQIRELSDRVILFFDRALYYLIRGYSEEMNRRMKSLWKLTDEDTDKIFFEKSFYSR